MVDVKRAAEILSELALIKFFPSDPGARTALVRIVCGMAANTEQIRWLVDRMLRLYPEWPGVNEVRACFCSRFRPLDGHEANSTIFLDGLPSEREVPGYPSLPPGRVASADRQIEAGLVDLAARKRLM